MSVEGKRNPPHDQFVDMDLPANLDGSILTPEDASWDLTEEDLREIVEAGFDKHQEALQEAKRRSPINN